MTESRLIVPKPKPRNKSRHRPGYFTQYMRIYRAKQKAKLAALRS